MRISRAEPHVQNPRLKNVLISDTPLSGCGQYMLNSYYNFYANLRSLCAVSAFVFAVIYIEKIYIRLLCDVPLFPYWSRNL